METTKDRLMQFLKTINESSRQFQINVGASNAYISNMVNGPSRRMLRKIGEKYPNLNIAWLTTGIGDMLLYTQESVLDNHNKMTVGKVKNLNSGNAEHVGDTTTTDKDMVALVKQLMESNKKKDEQIDRLLGMLSQTIDKNSHTEVPM